MQSEKISVKVTESGQTMEVVVLSKRADRIQVVLGQGVHSVQCDLVPTRSRQAYVGTVMGREIIYQRSCDAIQAELDRLNPALKRQR